MIVMLAEFILAVLLILVIAAGIKFLGWLYSLGSPTALPMIKLVAKHTYQYKNQETSWTGFVYERQDTGERLWTKSHFCSEIGETCKIAESVWNEWRTKWNE